MFSRAFAHFAWMGTVYTVLVILWGAYVRATGSGAGCGSHWPLCNGAVVPRLESAKTLIEFTHRVTSGLAWVWALALVVWALRAAPLGHPARRASAAVLFFMTTEALVGAGLVLFEMVAGNESIARAVWMACHLINTFLLLFSCAATCSFAFGGSRFRFFGRGKHGLLLFGCLGGVLLLAMSGAVAALGDTLFPATSLAHGIEQDVSPTAHILLRLRVLHPVIGLGVVGCVLGTLSSIFVRVHRARSLVALVAIGFVAQVALGFLNLGLLAPVALQLMHLFLADALWIGLVLVSASVLGPEAEAHELATPAAPRATT